MIFWRGAKRAVSARNSCSPELDSPPPPPSIRRIPAATRPPTDALHGAIRKFWLNYDPARPPKSPEIVDWLMVSMLVYRRRWRNPSTELSGRKPHRKGGNIKLSKSTFQQSEVNPNPLRV